MGSEFLYEMNLEAENSFYWFLPVPPSFMYDDENRRLDL